MSAITGCLHTPLSTMLKRHRIFEICTILFFIFRWFILPIMQTGQFNTILNLGPLFLIGGYYPAFFIGLSHNFKGVYILEDTSRESTSREESFLYKQVRIFDPPAQARIGGHYFHAWCPSVRHENKNALQL